ncbi:MAG: HAD family hydrolase [Proteobacteria bacterium]|nr:HAD family hydrolase [Pseudomonadota bacterium]
MQRLVLFDIDGTLMLLDNVANNAFSAMAKELFGVEASIFDVRCSGKTDSLILEEVLLAKGIDEREIEAKKKLAFERYCFYFENYLNNGDSYRIYPGVIPLLENLSNDLSVHVGLLTGNVEFTAWKKLEKAGLHQYFSFGAFGNESKVRSELVGIALERAKEKLGITFAGREAVIIGDSVHDVKCGKEYGTRSIAVATGFHSKEELLSAEPDVLFDDLSDYRKVIDVILS